MGIRPKPMIAAINGKSATGPISEALPIKVITRSGKRTSKSLSAEFFLS